MRLRIVIPEAQVSPSVLNAGLETLTRINERLLADGEVPTFHEAQRQRAAQGLAPVVWKPEPPGEERFDHARCVLQRGWGDCDDLAPWRAASMRHTGEDPNARSVVIKTGPNRWHAIVEKGDGTTEDPSREAGMGSKTKAAPGVAGGAVCGPMTLTLKHDVSGGDYDPGFRTRPVFGVKPWGGQWYARTDLPLYETDYQLSALHRSPVAAQAIRGSVLGAVYAGEASEAASDLHMARLCCMQHLLRGGHPRDLEHIVGLFGIDLPSVSDIVDTVKHVAEKVVNVANVALSAVPAPLKAAFPALAITQQAIQHPELIPIPASGILATVAKQIGPTAVQQLIAKVGPAAETLVQQWNRAGIPAAVVQSAISRGAGPGWAATLAGR